MLKRRKSRSSASSYDAIINQLQAQPPLVPAVSAQQVWTLSVAHVSRGLTRMEEKAQHPPPSEPDVRFIVENLLKAMWSFEWLRDAGSGDRVEAARVLAESVREILEGLRNDQAERVIAGVSSTSVELKRIISS